MGAWVMAREVLEETLGDRLPILYVGRPRSASPSEGSSALHALHQRMLIEQAFAVHETVDAR
jgi:2-oxoglutarate dehydrogenase E1 component